MVESMEDQFLGPDGGWKPCLQPGSESAAAGQVRRDPLRPRRRATEPILLPPAIPDRRQLRRRRRNCGDAAAEPRGGDSFVARIARRLGLRKREGPLRARWIRSGYRVEWRTDGVGRNPVEGRRALRRPGSRSHDGIENWGGQAI